MAIPPPNNFGPPPNHVPPRRFFDPCYTFIEGSQAKEPKQYESVAESNEIYTRMGCVGTFTGKHLRDGEIRKPMSATAIPERDLIAVIHNGRLISLFNCTTHHIEQTFVVRDPVGFQATRGLRGELVADNFGYLYVTSEGAVAILRFNFDSVKDSANVHPEVFATVPNNTNRFFRGMAISLARNLFFTAYGKEIFAFALHNGALMYRWPLPEDLQSALVQSAVDMHMGAGVPPQVFIVSTAQGGSKLFGKILNFDGEPDNGVQMIGRDLFKGLGQVRRCAFDAVTNLIAADSNRRLIHVFPPAGSGPTVSFAPPEENEITHQWIIDLNNDTVNRIFNPSSVTVLVDPHSQRRQPLVVATDFTLDALVFFAAEPSDRDF